MRFRNSRGERRHDDAERHRQQHVAVGLRQRQAERRAGHALAARQRLDAGAHLLGDARRGVEAEAQHRRHRTSAHGGGICFIQRRRARRAATRASRSTTGTSAPAAGCCGTARRRRCRARTDPLDRRRAHRADDRAERQRDDPGGSAVASVQPSPTISHRSRCPCRPAPAARRCPSSSCSSSTCPSQRDRTRKRAISGDVASAATRAVRRRCDAVLATCRLPDRPSRSDSRPPS